MSAVLCADPVVVTVMVEERRLTVGVACVGVCRCVLVVLACVAVCWRVLLALACVCLCCLRWLVFACVDGVETVFGYYWLK
jgi:hypothetical protein